jgi:signal peptidase II
MTSSRDDGAVSWRWFGLALLIIACDQLTKIAILCNIPYGDARIVSDYFNLTLIYNPGAAFSFLAYAGGWQRWLFTGLGLIASIIIIRLLKRHPQHILFCLSLSLILGGALGNVIDRLLYGHVIDFLDFHFQDWHWPPFNLADSAITCGAGLLILNEWRRVKAT